MYALVIQRHAVFGDIASLGEVSTSASGGLDINALDSTRRTALPPSLRSLAAISDALGERALFERYGAKKFKTARDFARNLPHDEAKRNIRPYIERRQAELVQLAVDQHLPMVLRDPRDPRRATRIQVVDQDLRIIFEINRINNRMTSADSDTGNATGVEYSLRLTLAGQPVPTLGRPMATLSDSPAVLILDGRLYRPYGVKSSQIALFTLRDQVEVPERLTERFYETFVCNTLTYNTVRARGFRVETLEAAPAAVVEIHPGVTAAFEAKVWFDYGQARAAAASPGRFLVTSHDPLTYNTVRLIRDAAFEQRTLDTLAAMGLREVSVNAFAAAKPHTDALAWANANAQALSQAGIAVETTGAAQSNYLGTIELRIDIRQVAGGDAEFGGNDFFEVRASLDFGGLLVPIVKLRHNILHNNPRVELPNGLVATLPDSLMARLADYALYGRPKGNALRISRLHKQRLDIAQSSAAAPAADVQQTQPQFVDEIPATPPELNAQLRPYQIDGFQWLAGLAARGAGGILADDMGLGKTLQIITLLAHHYDHAPAVAPSHFPTPPPRGLAAQPAGTAVQLSLFDQPPAHTTTGKTSKNNRISNQKEANHAESCQPGQRLPSLVVAPASLVANWLAELARFAPRLRARAHVGANRSITQLTIRHTDIFVTTYGTLRNDIDTLEKTRFQFLVLDESQALKNPTSASFGAVRRLVAHTRVALTGTPVENSVGDLWAQMEAVNPGLLMPLAAFRQRFAASLEHGDAQRANELRSIVGPYMLRRTKTQVASDLPPKTEQTVACDMTDAQADLYTRALSAARNECLQAIDSKSGSHKLMVLREITRLRLLANDPRLAAKETATAHGGDIDPRPAGGKFAAVAAHLDALAAEGHKTLIFSSFTRHLKLYTDYCDQRGHRYALLTGSTPPKARATAVATFQNSRIPFFFISLKAGGFGLNLQAADYVLLLDPWWNPQAENQAIDRCHRIGQQNSVFVYRYIASGTIEEKIQRLQERKSSLAAEIVDTNDTAPPLDDATLRQLLS